MVVVVEGECVCVGGGRGLLVAMIAFSSTPPNLCVTDGRPKSGPLALWKGLGPTLWRDVPFSAVYWAGYENTKAALVHAYPESMVRRARALVCVRRGGGVGCLHVRCCF